MPRDKRGWHVAPAPDGRGMPQQAPTGPPPHRRQVFWWFVLGLLALNWLSLLFFQPSSGESRVTVPFSPYFLERVKSDQVGSISSKGDTIEGKFKEKLTYGKASPTKLFATEVPTFWNGSQLSALLQEKGVQINAKSTSTSQSLLAELLLGFGPTLLIVGLFVLLAKRAARAGGAMGALGNFGRSQARRVDPEKIRVTFDDVAGIDEAKSELTEIVDFLRNPEHYSRLGGRMPHGVLLSGAPGTGKTLLARAVAGEAHAAFFSISASEFIEAIVGVGASRVRDLFAKAKEAAPAIVFIDELDAIGRSRQGSVSVTGANDEREQTLDQILTEIDGFEPAEAVIVLAATNRPDVLDPALLRPGRFDRRVTVQAPDRKGRAAILKVHTRSIPLAEDVDLDALASSTPGMVGADLANLANEAALLGARRGHERVADERFHRLAREDPARIPTGDPAEPGRPRADRLPRVRARARGDAHTGSRPRPQGLDHPARHGARGDALDTRQRPRLLHPPRTAGEDRRRARRARGGRDHLRNDQHRRRVGHPAAHADHPPDGRPLGYEPGGRADRRARRRRPGAAAARCQRDLPGYAPHRRRGGPASSSRMPTRKSTRLLEEHRDQLESLAKALLAAETLDSADAYAAAGLSAPTPEPAPAIV